MEIKRLPADEAMRLVTSMIKNNYVAEVAKILPNVISRGQSHTVMNGKPFYYTEHHLSSLRVAIKSIGEELLSVDILDNGDALAQLVELRKKVCLPYIFQTVMGKSEDWQKKRMSQQVHCRKAGREYSLLGKFTSDEVRQINDAIRIIALTLLSVELTTDYAPLPGPSDDVAEVDSAKKGVGSEEVCESGKKNSLSDEELDLMIYEEMLLLENG